MLLRLLLHGADREGLSLLYTASDGAICENASLIRLNCLAVSCAFLALHFPVFRKSRAKPIMAVLVKVIYIRRNEQTGVACIRHRASKHTTYQQYERNGCDKYSFELSVYHIHLYSFYRFSTCCVDDGVARHTPSDLF